MVYAPVPWNQWLVIYFVVIGIASGITLVGSLLDLGGTARSRVVELCASYISLFALVIAGAILVIDLGRPERFWMMLAGFPNPTSPMTWGAKLLALKGLLLFYQAYLIRGALAAEAAGLELNGPGVRVANAITHALLQGVSLALAIYPAFLLSRTWVSPLSRTPAAALLFLVSALLLGVAVWLLLSRLISASQVSEQLFRAMNVLLLLEVSTLGFQWLLLRSDASPSFVRRALETPAAVACAVAVAISFVFPLLSRLLMSRSRHVAAFNAAAIAIGAVGVRYLLFAGR
ncbi:MAG: NrfD/PsrC family molybdoenzyme membrane anchor subunit [Myxococcota bacterium]